MTLVSMYAEGKLFVPDLAYKYLKAYTAFDVTKGWIGNTLKERILVGTDTYDSSRGKYYRNIQINYAETTNDGQVWLVFTPSSGVVSDHNDYIKLTDVINNPNLEIFGGGQRASINPYEKGAAA